LGRIGWGLPRRTGGRLLKAQANRRTASSWIRRTAALSSSPALSSIPNGDSYAPPAGALLFAPPAGGRIWAAAHQRILFSYFVLFLFLKGFWLCFLQIFWISIFLLVFDFAGQFSNI
jgi:hypothetical protein